MNILVLGNGFDLAHGLPTKYADFLEWANAMERIICSFMESLNINKFEEDSLKRGIEKEDKIDKNAFIAQQLTLQTKIFTCTDNGKIKNYVENLFKIWNKKKINLVNELHDLLHGNIWLEYFLKNEKFIKENWIDFESEIANVIKAFDIVRMSVESKGKKSKYSIKNEVDNFKKIWSLRYQKDAKNIRTRGEIDNFIDLLDKDLKRLIRALEIYIEDYVKNIKIKKKSSDIMSLEVDKILNFNYSDTYERIYESDRKIEYDYIHGKADIENSIESNNMVLGMDEYLEDDRKNKDIEFISFKKYYQRIHNETGSKYKEWVDTIKDEYLHCLEMRERAKKKEEQYYISQNLMDSVEYSIILSERNMEYEIHNLYIFGHSLDVTDREVLKDLILNDNVHTTIYYVNKKVYGQQIANLVKVIGQEELIKRTGGNTKTITFKQQADI